MVLRGEEFSSNPYVSYNNVRTFNHIELWKVISDMLQNPFTLQVSLQ